MADRSKASENEKRHRDLQLQKLLKEEENRKRDIVSDMTRQYKSRFEELCSKGSELEREKDENKAKIERLDEDLEELETKHKLIEKDKIDEITGLKRQIDEMSQEFSAMLKTTLEKMAERIKEANRQWEEDNDGNVLKHFENTQLKQ
jgi:DNA anti-recombination protein RmuC